MFSRFVVGTILLLGVIVVGAYGWTVSRVTDVAAQHMTIAAINALGREPIWWERLLIEDGPPLIVLYFLLTVPTWVASILARSNSWYAGGIIGTSLGLIAGYVLSSFTTALIGALLLGVIGALFDHHISRHYQEQIETKQHPRWWAGGRHGGKVWKHFLHFTS